MLTSEDAQGVGYGKASGVRVKTLGVQGEDAGEGDSADVRNLRSNHSANLNAALALCKGWDEVHVGLSSRGIVSQGSRWWHRVIWKDEEMSTDWASQRSQCRGSQSWASYFRQNLDR